MHSICTELASAQLGYYPTLHLPQDTPSGKEGAMYWNDDQFLWMFGGTTMEEEPPFDNSNELWKFNLANREWYFVRNYGALAFYGEKVVWIHHIWS
jgi:hypothetical protein